MNIMTATNTATVTGMTLERYLRLIAGAFVVLSVALGILDKSLLVSVHGVRRLESVSIGLHELVSDDGIPSQAGNKVLLVIASFPGTTSQQRPDLLPGA